MVNDRHMPTVRAALDAGQQRLARLESPRQEAEWLLAAVLQCRRADFFSRPDAPVSGADWQRYHEALLRRAQGEPLDYILGQSGFRHLMLRVTPDVLIPRPETEQLVDRVLAIGGNRAISAVDMGTGSGAIALSLASERPAWRVAATDYSEAALAVARRNALDNDLRQVEFFRGDWFAALPAGRRFDIIVSNPPYVARGAPELQPEVARFEPDMALYAPEQGLAALRRLAEEAGAWLLPGGTLVLEHGFDQAVAVRGLLTCAGFEQVSSVRDHSGHERVTSGVMAANGRGDAHA